MSCVIDCVQVDLESRGITAEYLMEIFDIEEVSAKELLCGEIALKRSEIIEIANCKGIVIEELIGRPV